MKTGCRMEKTVSRQKAMMNFKIINIIENKVENLDEIVKNGYKIAEDKDLINVGKKYKDYYEYILNRKYKM